MTVAPEKSKKLDLTNYSKFLNSAQANIYNKTKIGILLTKVPLLHNLIQFYITLH